MDIVYLKLTNGDEIFGDRIGEEDNKILLDEVMVMETIQTEGEMKYLFMSRYSQYSDIHSMAIDKSSIVFIHEASEVVKNHYFISVQYANEISDDRFRKGITSASKYLSSVIHENTKSKEESKEKEDTFEDVKDKILGTFESDTNTKH